MRTVQIGRTAALLCCGMVMTGMIDESVHAQTCRPASGSQIFAPAAAQEGDTLDYSFTLTIATTPGACSALVTEVDFYSPDIFAAGGDDPCDNDGLALPVSGSQILNPGDFLRYSAVDTVTTNCVAASDINCEIVVPGLAYIVDPADVVGGVLPISGCWKGLALPQLIDEVTASQEDSTFFVAPDIDITKSSATTRICDGVDTEVTYNYAVTRGTSNVDIINVVVSDDLCGPVVRGPDNPGDNDDVLEAGETWTYSCTTTIDGETTNTATVTGNDAVLNRTVTDSAQFTIDANPPPTCIATADPADICEGESSEICVAPSGDNGPFDVVIRDPSGAVIQTCIDVPAGGECCIAVGPFPTAGSFIYTAEITDAVGCVGECETTVTVHDNPTCTVSTTPSDICLGDSSEVCANVTGGRPPYSFLWNTGATTQCITVSPTVTTEYCVTIVDDNGCTTECCGTVTVHENPVATPQGAGVCEGAPAQVCVIVTEGRPPYDVVWFNSSGKQVGDCVVPVEGGQCCLDVSTQDPGNFDYTAVVTDDNGCTAEATARLDVFPNRLVTVPDVDICEGEPLEICATVAGGTPPYEVTWTDSSGATIANCTVPVNNGQCCIIVTAEGEYCAHAVDANGCEGDDCGVLTVNTADCIATAEPGKICEGESAEICVSPTGDRPPFTVEIYNQAGVLMQTCNGVPNGGQCCVTVSPPAPGIYTFHAVLTDASGCVFGSPSDGECQVQLEVNQNPTCVVSPDPAEICEGDSIELCAIVSLGRPPYSFLWSNGATTQCITVSPAADTLYTVTVTDDNGCETSCERLVDVHPLPVCEISQTPKGDCPTELCAVVTGGRPPYSFEWSTGETTQCITVSPSSETLYEVIVTDDNGCITSCSRLVNCPGGEGCTPGYWKQPHHFDDWTDPYDPDDLFSEHFEDAFPGKTLLTVLSQPASSPPGPNALNNLGRHTVAALLNAASDGVAFPFGEQEVIDLFNAVFPGTDAEYTELKNMFAAANELGCPLNGNSDGNDDGLVDGLDLADLLGNWGGKGAGDVNQDGVVNGADLSQLLANWGS